MLDPFSDQKKHFMNEIVNEHENSQASLSLISEKDPMNLFVNFDSSHYNTGHDTFHDRSQLDPNESGQTRLTTLIL